MIKAFRERFAGFFHRDNHPPLITENSSLLEIAVEYPHAFDFLERKYGIKVDVTDKPLSLKEFCEKFGLPPAQILFADIQTSLRTRIVQEVPATQAYALMHQRADLKVLDVREDWEIKICRLPGSQVLRPLLLDEVLTEWPKNTPLLLYCHHGIRSLDAATFLADRGFTNVYTLKGGIEAWSLEVDPTVPRYENAWC